MTRVNQILPWLLLVTTVFICASTIALIVVVAGGAL